MNHWDGVLSFYLPEYKSYSQSNAYLDKNDAAIYGIPFEFSANRASKLVYGTSVKIETAILP